MKIMKIKVYLFITLIFLIFTGMKCDGGRKSISDLSCIKVENLMNDGQTLQLATSVIKQELYTLGVKYLDSDMKEQDYLCYFQRHVVNQKIYSNSQIDPKYPVGSDVTSFFTAYPSSLYIGMKYKLKRKITSGIHSFKVRFYREDGSVVEGDTEPIEFL